MKLEKKLKLVVILLMIQKRDLLLKSRNKIYNPQNLQIFYKFINICRFVADPPKFFELENLLINISLSSFGLNT